ncbi:SAM-dependent methyltransferase [Archangium sp. Cb G35]|uniref:SAM-dependent methyltransferase n=1 Tax=Archangium sp. Cb G35 TaxID=1920190 RepID=UPI0009592CDC|nr:methyltransferase domain-containing protein [Archangium sp. Cb G35]OJT27474.1 SAM-dependent methyltransferase [Archangium sp. Cb G35]
MGIWKAAVGVALLLGLGSAPAVGQDEDFISVPPNLGRSDLPERAPDVPYVPTPQPVVDAMLEVADVKPGDVLYDLGSGDGRIVVTAAQRFGVRGVGIDINPERVQEAEANAKAAGVERLTDFRQEDIFKADFGEATVVTMYLLPSVNNRLKPKLLNDLKPGTRIVSHAFDIEGWEPERIIETDGRTIYFWVVPE